MGSNLDAWTKKGEPSFQINDTLKPTWMSNERRKCDLLTDVPGRPVALDAQVLEVAQLLDVHFRFRTGHFRSRRDPAPDDLAEGQPVHLERVLPERARPVADLEEFPAQVRKFEQLAAAEVRGDDQNWDFRKIGQEQSGNLRFLSGARKSSGSFPLS